MCISPLELGRYIAGAHQGRIIPLWAMSASCCWTWPTNWMAMGWGGALTGGESPVSIKCYVIFVHPICCENSMLYSSTIYRVGIVNLARTSTPTGYTLRQIIVHDQGATYFCWSVSSYAKRDTTEQVVCRRALARYGGNRSCWIF